MQSVLGGRDTLCIMSTGSGKSAIYQLAGLLLEGPTVVVSPLIALQRDQVESIEGEEAGEAAVLNSTLSERAREAALEEAEHGELSFLLLAPEQLAKEEVVGRARRREAGAVRGRRGPLRLAVGTRLPPRLPQAGRSDRRLSGAPRARSHRDGGAAGARATSSRFCRCATRPSSCGALTGPTSTWPWSATTTPTRKRRALIDAVVEAEPPGIVYVATRRACEEVAEELVARGVRACGYHGGLGARRRDEVQEAFMADRDCQVVVATVAFGMGVDKRNVRWVFHEHVSDSVDSYYQELGRAGRDGEPARTRLFYRPEDLGVRRFFAGGAVDHDALHRVGQVLVQARRPVEPSEILDQVEISKTKLATALHHLVQAGAVRMHEDGAAEAAVAEKVLDEAAQEAAQAEEHRLSFDRSRIEMMRAYAEHDGCRRAFVLGYFGEEYEPPCGNCDNCDRGLAPAGSAAQDAGFDTGTRVRHEQWGEGTVGQVEDGQLTVVFDTVGYKTLDAGLVRERGLLTAVE